MKTTAIILIDTGLLLKKAAGLFYIRKPESEEKFFTRIYSFITAFFLIWHIQGFALTGIPDLNSKVAALSEYMISEDFIELSLRVHDTVLLDSIYSKSLDINNGDISEALLTLTFATFPFKEIEIEVPIIKLRMFLKFSEAPDSLFSKRLNALPAELLFDSPKDKLGDKDKLPHFFGSAFISYNSNLRILPLMAGIIVELTEAALKVRGGLDSRDLILNDLGNFFGWLLNYDEKLMPSSIIKLYSLLYFRV